MTGRAATANVPKLERHLLWYRILAFATGVVLISACVLWFVTDGLDEHGLDKITGLVWMFHGWLYLVYFLVAAALGIKVRWNWLRIAAVLAAGTIPTASFVAEHYVTRDLRARIAAGSAAHRAAGAAAPTGAAAPAVD